MRNLLKKNGELQVKFANTISQVRDVKVYTQRWINNGRNLISIEENLIFILNELGYKYKKGNDAPRRGAEGNFVKMSKPAFNKLKSLV